jgi:hypothetical protein
MTGTPLQSTMAPEDVMPLRPKGKTIAEGSLVSVFRGGLMAVRIIDDEIAEINDTPEIVDMTKPLPKSLKPSSFLSKFHCFL